MSDSGVPAIASKASNVNHLYRSNLVIGLTGPFGSGCSEMYKILKDRFSFQPFKISNCIKKELQQTDKAIAKGKEGWRKILQEHGNEKRRLNKAYWVEKIIEEIDNANVGNNDIVIDGFRNFQETQAIRKIYPRFFLVAMYAEKEERAKRVVQKDYNGDYSEFVKDDRRDKNQEFDWGQSVQRCVDNADYVFYNNQHLAVTVRGTEEPDDTKIKRILEEQANDFVPLMREEKDVRKARPEEIQIATAYAQSNSSTCMKRHVGAVITIRKNEKEFVISAGYNENPANANIKTCPDAGACYKDEDMASKLAAQCKKIYCPSCGQENKNLEEPWVCSKCGDSFKEWLRPNRNMELCTAIHAEERAILSLAGRPAKGGTLYVTTFPCFQCARLILDAEISKIVFVEAYPVSETANFLAQSIDVEPFTGFTARAFFRVFKKVN